MSEEKIGWIRKRVRIDWKDFDLVSQAVNEGGAATFAEGALLTPATDVTVVPVEISDYGIAGLVMAVADSDDGNFIHGRFPVPYDLDPQYKIGFRILWTQTAAVSAGVTWILKAGTDKAGAVIQAEDGAGIVALDTPLVESNSTGAALERLWTRRGLKTSIGLTRTEILAGADLRLQIECDIVDATLTYVTLLGVEYDYSPIRSFNSRFDREAPLRE